MLKRDFLDGFSIISENFSMKLRHQQLASVAMLDPSQQDHILAPQQGRKNFIEIAWG